MMYSLSGAIIAVSWKHKQPFSFHLVVVFHAPYTVKLSDKYEIVLKEIRCNYVYLVLGLKDKYVEI